MADKTDLSLGVSVAALVASVYSAAMPTLADLRGQVDTRGHMAAAERTATAICVGLVVGMAAVTRSSEVAGIGLLAVVGLAAAYAVARNSAP